MKKRTDTVGIRNASAVHGCEQHADIGSRTLAEVCDLGHS